MPSRSVSISAWRRSLAEPAIFASTTPTRRRKTSSTSTRFRKTFGGWVSPGTTDPLYASDYFEKLYEYAQHLIRERPRLRRRAHSRGDARAPGHADRARDGQPVSRSASRREPRPLFPDAGGRVSGRRARSAREDRHGLAEHQPARSRALPDPPRAPSPDRRRLVHLSDVRLRASAIGRARTHHALALHARVRGSPPALRLADRAPAGAVHSRARSSSRA